MNDTAQPLEELTLEDIILRRFFLWRNTDSKVEKAHIARALSKNFDEYGELVADKIHKQAG